MVPLLQARGLFRRDYPGTTLRESLGLALPANQFQNNKENHAMQKTTLLLAVALAFSASSWGQDVKINGTGEPEANKTPIHTAKNPQAIALLPQDLHLAVPGNSPSRWRPELSAADGLCR
ncbi:Putative monooxygenase MoxC [Klebsiella pneumoniae]|nr:Putative monooxygenase MoxC [Klebsiella pneumoniae]